MMHETARRRWEARLQLMNAFRAWQRLLLLRAIQDNCI
jgi:hypothetical protein